MKLMLFAVLSSCCLCIFAETQQARDGVEVNVADHRPGHSGQSKSNHSLPITSQRLTVLLVSVPSVGHLSPLLALGEELVRRGHDVTLHTSNVNDSKFIEKIRAKTIRVGLKFVSTGQSIFKLTLEGQNVGEGVVSSGMLKAFSVLGDEAEIVLDFMDKFIEPNNVDIVIGEDFLATALACASRRYQLPTISMSSTLQVLPYTYPPWPWPGMLFGAVSDNLTFQQRLLIPFERVIGDVMQNYVIMPPQISKVVRFCHDMNARYASIALGTRLPQIIPSVIGIEYPRTISPLTHYVGPVLTKSSDPLPTDLQMWLNEKLDRSVIYISMGSHVPMTEVLGTAIVNAIANTSYSAVWAVRNSSLLDTLTVRLNRSKLFVSSWAPQLSVLGHRAIRMAILHGGANGVHEALYNGVPVIVLPRFGDQMYLAGRVSHNKLGVHILANNLSSSSISNAIKQVDCDIYVRNIQRLNRIFKQAGGAERAADLVEHYADIGYSHLVPAYAKYDWNWIQYYNVDVYLTWGILLGLVLYASFRCCRCTFSRCCTCCQGKVKED